MADLTTLLKKFLDDLYAGKINVGGTSDALLWREAANYIAQRNSTSAQRFSVANTYTSTTNNELFSVDWQTTANTAIAGTRTAATGTGRQLNIVAQDSSASTSAVPTLRMRAVGAGGAPFFHVGLATSMTGLTYGGAWAAAGDFMRVSDFTNTVTSGSVSALAVLPTYNQSSGTAANTDLLINRTETAVGSGAQLLIDGQVGGSSRFTVNSSGTVTSAAGTATPAGGSAAASTRIGSAGVGLYIGTGAPSVSAAKGSLYVRTDATTTTTRLYINTDGGTTWTTFTSAA